MKNNNGNPVPSLEIDDFVAIRDGLYKLRLPSGRRDEIIEKLRKILENGVETNKEYPEFTVSGKKRELVG